MNVLLWLQRAEYGNKNFKRKIITEGKSRNNIQSLVLISSDNLRMEDNDKDNSSIIEQ
jgi:hypothetical protein